MFWAGWLAVLVFALWVRFAWIPVTARHVFDGHEGEYLAIFLGGTAGPASTQTVPLVAALYRGLGLLGHNPRLLLACSAVAGLVSLAAVMRLVQWQAGSRAALLAGLLLACYGNHAFWCSSAYHVMLPFSLLMVGLAIFTARAPLFWWLATLPVALAFGTRPELACCLPATALLRGKRGLGAWTLWALATLLLAVGVAWPLLQPGAHPAGLWRDALLAWVLNIRLLDFLAPWSSLPALAVALVLSAVAAWRWRRAATFWVCLALGTWLPACAFADAGFRHALLAGTSLAALSAMGLTALAVAPVPGQGPVLARRVLPAGLGALTLALMLRDTATLAENYYAPAARIAPRLAALAAPSGDDTPFTGCHWISEEPPLPGQALRSYLTVHSTEACLLWGEEYQHRTWTSRGLLDRGLRMHALFGLQPVALRVWPADPGRPARLVWRLTTVPALATWIVSRQPSTGTGAGG